MNAFFDIDEFPGERRDAEHAGVGPIAFRRLMGRVSARSSFDFVDFTVIPAGSSIGRHHHEGNEELYFVVSGRPAITVNGTERRAKPGTLAVVRSGEWHQLVNDTAEDVTILVVQSRDVAP